MSLDDSIARVRRAELAFDASTRKVADHGRLLQQTWRDAWTPGRILIAGLASGFMLGRGELPIATGSDLIKLVTALDGLLAVARPEVEVDADEDAVDPLQGDSAQA